MEWGTPVYWGKFLLFCVLQSVKTKETYPTRPGSPTPCKQALRKESNSHRICLQHQHRGRFIVLEHQYGGRDVM